ncbi:unnamed protein product, partial [Amoebophrya sp. A25]
KYNSSTYNDRVFVGRRRVFVPEISGRDQLPSRSPGANSVVTPPGAAAVFQLLGPKSNSRISEEGPGARDRCLSRRQHQLERVGTYT